MQALIRPTVLDSKTPKRSSGKIFLIIAVIFFILMFIPDPIKLIPFVGEGEELAEGGISLSAILIYIIRYWLYNNIKEQIITK